MKILLKIFCLFLLATNTFAQTETHRTVLFSNSKVNVWQTVIYPNVNQQLKSHRHEHDRIVVAFNSGVLKISNDKGKTHYLKLIKDQAYYLKKDVPNELHTDENISNHPIKVMVIELN